MPSYRRLDVGSSRAGRDTQEDIERVDTETILVDTRGWTRTSVALRAEVIRTLHIYALSGGSFHDAAHGDIPCYPVNESLCRRIVHDEGEILRAVGQSGDMDIGTRIRPATRILGRYGRTLSEVGRYREGV